MPFKLASKFKPTGDQPQAIESLVGGVESGKTNQVLLGVTGSGKTFTVANVIQKIQKPTLVIAHNKTLAAQLYQEFRDFFPENAVSYFVSYYDYYQPEAYIPSSDTYIEKDASINDEIDKLRLATTTNLMTRQDVIVVASVSCIYNLGSPVEYGRYMLRLMPGELISRKTILLQLANLQYDRSDTDLMRGTYRLRGDILQIWPAYEDRALQIDTLENQITRIDWIDPISGQYLPQTEEEKMSRMFVIYPAKHYVVNPKTKQDSLNEIRADLKARVAEFEAAGRPLEAYRLKQKVEYDIDMIENLGFVNGIENYSRYFDGRQPGEAPYSLIDYFRENTNIFNNDGFLTVIDESHMSVPQIRAMYNGDQARKRTLIDYGFRLPSALDNRPLKFDEFLAKNDQFIFVSATPADWEVSQAHNKTVEQLIRPTGLLDPEVEIRPTKGQVEDMVIEILLRKQKGQRVLVTTLTKKMAEALTDFLNTPEKIAKLVKSFTAKRSVESENPNPEKPIAANEQIPAEKLDIGPVPDRFLTTARIPTELSADKLLSQLPKVAYLHSDVEVFERSDILDNLRRGEYDVVVGINLLREGLDLPEVTLVAILDADKEGFLRSETSLVQTMGRAARHQEGHVVLYADKFTRSIKASLTETQRRRRIQIEYNKKHNITPTTVQKKIRERMIEKKDDENETTNWQKSGTKKQTKTVVALSKKENIVLEELDPNNLLPSDKKKIISQLKRRMNQAAKDLDYEFAAQLRDTLLLLETQA